MTVQVEALRASHQITLPLCKQFGLNPIAGHYETGFFNGNAKVWNLPAGRRPRPGAAQAKSAVAKEAMTRILNQGV